MIDNNKMCYYCNANEIEAQFPIQEWKPVSLQNENQYVTYQGHEYRLVSMLEKDRPGLTYRIIKCFLCCLPVFMTRYLERYIRPCLVSKIVYRCYVITPNDDFQHLNWFDFRKKYGTEGLEKINQELVQDRRTSLLESVKTTANLDQINNKVWVEMIHLGLKKSIQEDLKDRLAKMDNHSPLIPDYLNLRTLTHKFVDVQDQKLAKLVINFLAENASKLFEKDDSHHFTFLNSHKLISEEALQIIQKARAEFKQVQNDKEKRIKEINRYYAQMNKEAENEFNTQLHQFKIDNRMDNYDQLKNQLDQINRDIAAEEGPHKANVEKFEKLEEEIKSLDEKMKLCAGTRYGDIAIQILKKRGEQEKLIWARKPLTLRAEKTFEIANLTKSIKPFEEKLIQFTNGLNDEMTNKKQAAKQEKQITLQETQDNCVTLLQTHIDQLKRSLEKILL